MSVEKATLKLTPPLSNFSARGKLQWHTASISISESEGSFNVFMKAWHIYTQKTQSFEERVNYTTYFQNYVKIPILKCCIFDVYFKIPMKSTFPLVGWKISYIIMYMILVFILWFLSLIFVSFVNKNREFKINAKPNRFVRVNAKGVDIVYKTYKFKYKSNWHSDTHPIYESKRWKSCIGSSQF